jgi:hypothetical protein
VDDTVGDIFEGETDNQKRMIKVIPSFVNRMFSIPTTSNLRPGSASKRARETSEEHGNKRRRLEADQREIMDMDPVRDRPLASTESDRGGESYGDRVSAQIQAFGNRTTRSRTGNSLIFVEDSQTGNPEFVAQLKEESPELGFQPPSRPIAMSPGSTFKKPLLPASRQSAAGRPHARSPVESPQRLSDKSQIERGIGEYLNVEDDDTQVGLGPTPSPQANPEEIAILESPKSIQEQVEKEVSQNDSMDCRANRMTTSPPFMKSHSKNAITYGRSPNARNNIERDLSLLNSSRPDSTSAQNNPNEENETQAVRGKKGRLFQVAQLDEIESTPQENVTSASGRDAETEDADAIMEDVRFTNGTSATEEDAPRPGKQSLLTKPKRKSYTMPVTPKTTRGSKIADTRSNGVAKSASTNTGNASKFTPNEGVEDAAPSAKKQRKPRSDRGMKRGRRSGISDTTFTASPQLRESEPHDDNTAPVPTTVSPRKRGRPFKTANRELANTASIPPPKRGRTSTAISATPAKASQSVPRPRGRPPKVQNVTAREESPLFVSEPQELANAAANKLSKDPGMTNNIVEDALSVSSAGSSPEQPSAQINEAEAQEGEAEAYSSEAEGDDHEAEADEHEAEAEAHNNEAEAYNNEAEAHNNEAEAHNNEAEAHDNEVEVQNGETEAQNGEVETQDAETVIQDAGAEAQNGETEAAKALIAQPSPSGPSEYSSIGLKLTASIKKHHKNVMKKMFPGGHVKARKQEDKTREQLGDLPKTPAARKASKRSDIVEDALFHAGLNGHTVPDDLEYHLQSAAATNEIQASDSKDPRTENSIESSSQPVVQDPGSNPAPWNSESWGFQSVGLPNGDSKETNVERMDVENASGSRSESPSGPRSGGTTESEPELEAEDASNSKSASAANSARSSPEMGRRPARFLSHSPTPDKSGSDEESETSRSRSHSRAVSPKLANGDIDSDSDDSSDKSSDDASDASEDEDADEDDEKKLNGSPLADPPSSPPEVTPHPVTLVPATQSSQLRNLSQATRRITPDPNTPLASATQPTPRASAGPIRSRLARGRSAYTGFPTVGEQLASVKKDSAAKPEIKKFDPKTHSLGILSKGKRNPFDGSDTSSDDSSSSSEEEDGKGESAASCSVA